MTEASLEIWVEEVFWLAYAKNFIKLKTILNLVKTSTAAFWILTSLILTTGVVFVIGILFPNQDNLEIIKIFVAIMERIIILVGGGYFGLELAKRNKLKERMEND